jgi:hypothetical protein
MIAMTIFISVPLLGLARQEVVRLFHARVEERSALRLGVC